MYFSSINTVAIDVDGSGNLDALKNLTARAKISDELLNNSGFYETVTIVDGERPDILSKRLYKVCSWAVNDAVLSVAFFDFSLPVDFFFLGLFDIVFLSIIY